MLAADGCASSSSDPACCFCGVWAPGGPREWRSPCSGSHSFGHAHLTLIASVGRSDIFALFGILMRGSVDLAALVSEHSKEPDIRS
jgi:hypothetical protein